MFLLTTLTAIVVYAVSAAADLVLQHRDTRGGKQLRWQSVFIAIVALTVSIFAIIGSGLQARRLYARSRSCWFALLSVVQNGHREKHVSARAHGEETGRAQENHSSSTSMLFAALRS